jgi:hypothetical protein
LGSTESNNATPLNWGKTTSGEPGAVHLWSRWQRKLLSHTLAVLLCQRAGLASLRFADLLTS